MLPSVYVGRTIKLHSQSYVAFPLGSWHDRLNASLWLSFRRRRLPGVREIVRERRTCYSCPDLGERMRW